LGINSNINSLVAQQNL
nr:flagellin {N-terminal} [Pseudomonas pseudomallei, 319a, Peptide Partial, 16 aa] [Burkholderia pseudomallei]